ncbi:MAG: 2OG-Fe(II) oxygenase family protein, partial [Pseudomonadota bacterium]
DLDISRFLAGNLSPAELAALAVACEDQGFFLLSGHQLDGLIEAVFAESAVFFAQPRTVKAAVYRDAENPLGYYDRELTKQKRDQKEVFDFKAGGYITRNKSRQTRWPDHRAAFRSTLTDFFQGFTTLAEQTMQMIFVSLGMPRQVAEDMVAEGFGEHHSSAARLNYYPGQDPVPHTERAGVTALGDMALHHHTDPGAITLLLQDDHGGLQARSKTRGWIDVPPAPGTIVVNVGDVLQVWTNDRCTAAVHRVLPVHSERGRYSTPFFYQPRYDAMISPWVQGDEQPRYRDFAWRDFIRGRVTDNYADLGEDDIQIEKYRVA